MSEINRENMKILNKLVEISKGKMVRKYLNTEFNIIYLTVIIVPISERPKAKSLNQWDFDLL